MLTPIRYWKLILEFDIGNWYKKLITKFDIWYRFWNLILWYDIGKREKTFPSAAKKILLAVSSIAWYWTILVPLWGSFLTINLVLCLDLHKIPFQKPILSFWKPCGRGRRGGLWDLGWPQGGCSCTRPFCILYHIQDNGDVCFLLMIFEINGFNI